MQNFLGLDWGEKKIGLAIADAETRVALALTTLPNTADLFEKLNYVIVTENVGTVVIGIPTYVHQETAISSAEKLGEKLKTFGLEVYYQDEMFTTKMAKQNLIERGGKRIEEHDDPEAARIILESYLSQIK